MRAKAFVFVRNQLLDVAVVNLANMDGQAPATIRHRISAEQAALAVQHSLRHGWRKIGKFCRLDPSISAKDREARDEAGHPAPSR